MIVKALVVPGLPQVLLAPEKSPGWARLRKAYDEARREIEAVDADLILYFSTQWLSVLGYTFQADPSPEWTHVDQNFHDLGSMPYAFRIDPDFGQAYAKEVKALGHHTMLANYRGFPVDTGTIVAQKLLNPANRLPAAMISCNMYSEKAETIDAGRAGLRALEKSGKKAVAVLVTSLSSRFFVKEIDPAHDKISSAKDDEWNRKICELLAEGRLNDVAEVARDFAREANGDMGFKGAWWLSGLCGESNDFSGRLYGYEPIWGTGAAVVALTPTAEIRAKDGAPTATVASGKSESPKNKQNLVIDAAAAPEPVGAYPHARREGDLLFLSGVGPRTRNSKKIPGVELGSGGEILAYDVETQTRAVIANVKAILEASGSSLEKVIDVQVFLTNMKKDFPAFNKVYAEYFAKIQATRTTVEVGALPTPIAVEFKVIARP